MSNLMLLNYLAALCGEGKTKKVCEHINNLLISNTAMLKCEVYIYAAPSEVLTDKVHQFLLNDAPDSIKKQIIKITHDPKGDRVVNRIINEIKMANESNKSIAICITHKGFDFLTKINRTDILKNVTLFGDEIMENLIDVKPICIPYHTFLLTDYIEIDTSSKFKTGSDILPIKLKNIEAAKRLIKHSQNSVDKIIKPIIEDLVCGNYDVFVHKDNWDKLVVQGIVSEDITRDDRENGSDKNHLYFISLANENIFKPFKEVTLMSAHYERSLQYIWWTRIYTELTGKPAFEFQKSPLGNGLNDTIHTNGFRIESIEYFQDKDYSISKGNAQLDEDDVNSPTRYKMSLDVFTDEIKRSPEFKGIVAYNTNATQIEHENITTASIKSHGQNIFTDKNAAYVLATLNMPPMFYRILKALGFSQYEIDVATKYEFYYQFVMRTSLRDKNSIIMIRIRLMDKKASLYVFEQFEGAPEPKLMEGGIAHNPFSMKTYQSDYHTQEKQVAKRRLINKAKYINQQITKLKTISADNPNSKRISKLCQSIKQHKEIYVTWAMQFEETYNEQYNSSIF